MNLQDVLKQLGLSISEAKIYLSLLRFGEMKVADIQKKAIINSGRMYDILSSLECKGFISKVIKNNIKVYRAAPPSILQEFLKNKKEEIVSQENLIIDEMKNFDKLYSTHLNSATVEVYTGQQGMRTAFEILFANAKKGDTHYVIGIAKENRFPSWLMTLLEFYIYPTRKRLSLVTKKLMNEEARKEKFWHKDNSQIRYLPWGVLTSYDILGDTVILEIFQSETIALVIRNKQVADDFKEHFEILWKIAKK